MFLAGPFTYDGSRWFQRSRPPHIESGILWEWYPSRFIELGWKSRVYKEGGREREVFTFHDLYFVRLIQIGVFPLVFCKLNLTTYEQENYCAHGSLKFSFSSHIQHKKYWIFKQTARLKTKSISQSSKTKAISTLFQFSTFLVHFPWSETLTKKLIKGVWVPILK